MRLGASQSRLVVKDKQDSEETASFRRCAYTRAVLVTYGRVCGKISNYLRVGNRGERVVFVKLRVLLYWKLLFVFVIQRLKSLADTR